MTVRTFSWHLPVHNSTYINAYILNLQFQAQTPGILTVKASGLESIVCAKRDALQCEEFMHSSREDSGEIQHLILAA